MRFYEIVVEQLDLAAELLQEQHPMQSRLGLILVDNAVEYALHRYATDCFALNSVPSHLSVLERRKQHQKRTEVCGQHLKPKIAFARCQDAITEDQATFVRKAHEFRNQAYHAGRANDLIITQLVAVYYSVFCQMLPSLAPRMMSFRLDGILSHRVRRHMNKETATPLPDAKAIAESLMRALPQLRSSLPGACRDSLAEWLSDIRSIIDYLVRNDPAVGDAKSLILDTQFWNAFWGAAPVEGLTVRVNDAGVAELDTDQKDEWEDALRQIHATWSPRVSLNTLDRWERRITELDRESEAGTLLQKYCKLQSEMEPFRRMLSERCGRLDQHIDELIERRSFGE